MHSTFETYFDKEYTLKKLTTEHYVRDSRFEPHGAAIKWGADYPARWYDARQLELILKQEDWSDAAILCHHTHFDGLILDHHYGVRPRLWLDSLSMARLLLGNHLSVSLDSVRAYFGLSVKRTPYHLFEGRHWRDLDRTTQELIAEGCCDEVESIWTIFGKLAKEFPSEEYEVVDMTIRMFTEPVLKADVNLLAKVWEDEERTRRDRERELGIDSSDLQSSERFAALLRAAGVEPATKKGKHGDIYAFAKTDEFIRELLEDDNPYIRGLAEARVGAKSTLLQSRAETLGTMANRGAMCVYLRYSGAHTTRWSGGDSTNWQNFKRGSDLRRAICAPNDYYLLVIDLAQTECRILNYLAGQEDVIERFRNGADPYTGIASAFYNRPITKDDPSERGTGKQAELSCGFGCGAEKFRRVAALGTYGPRVQLSDDDAAGFVKLYRDTHPRVVAYWREAGNNLSWLNGGLEKQWGPFTIRNRRLLAPTGLRMNFDTLSWHREQDDAGNYIGEDYWRLKTRQGWSKYYGAKLVENGVQFLARLVMSQAMLRLNRAGFRPVMTSHDDVAVLVPRDGREKQAVEFCVEEVRRTPDWLPGIPLDAEAHLGERYEK